MHIRCKYANIKLNSLQSVLFFKFVFTLNNTNGIDCCWKWHRLFQMASTVYEREINDGDQWKSPSWLVVLSRLLSTTESVNVCGESYYIPSKYKLSYERYQFKPMDTWNVVSHESNLMHKRQKRKELRIHVKGIRLTQVQINTGNA